jgi:4-amino-4-deoxy-L-arabinose transferase-like glycosyltransferase
VSPNRRRLFWAAITALLAIMGMTQARSARLECQTFDEALHLAAGYSYLRTGDFRMGREQPPLGKMLNALPLLLWLKPRLPLADPSWIGGDEWQFGSRFLYGGEIPADTILGYARLVTIALTFALGLFLAMWTRRHFGAEVALLATFLFALDPNVIAHGRYVTTDMIATAAIFAATMALARFIVSARASDGLLAGALLGLTIVSKFSALILIPVYVVLYFIHWWREGCHTRGGRLFVNLGLSLAILGSVSAVVIGAAYWSETWRMFRGRLAPLAVVVDSSRPAGPLFRSAGDLFHLPAHAFFLGLLQLANHSQLGDPSYVLGHSFPTGVWYYFPVVFAVKTPTAILLSLLLLALGAFARFPVKPVSSPLSRIRNARFEWFVLTVPVILYFASSLQSHINLGLRHILPIYPFLFVITAAALFQLRTRRFAKLFPIALFSVVAVAAAESVHVYPHYLAFFNTLAGGPVAGPKYLVDSNIDWGQDLKKLKIYLDERHISSVCLSYFGMAIPEYYGIHRTNLRSTDASGGGCVAAVSATLLYGAYTSRQVFAPLRQLQPIDRIGYSIYIFDLREQTR